MSKRDIIRSTCSPKDYQTGKTLGKGSYAVVKEAVKVATREIFAVKIISKEGAKGSGGNEAMVTNEIDVLKSISRGHPNILNLWDCFETANHVYLVIDMCTGGDLFYQIYQVGMFYEDHAINIIKTILSAIEYLHGLNIVHRDIKPENILYKDNSISSKLILTDFGLSKYVGLEASEACLKHVCGTPDYMAPEIYSKVGYGMQVDVWAVGVIAFFLLSGYKPFEDSKDHKKVDMTRLLSGAVVFKDQDWADVSGVSIQFIKDLLQVDPAKRLTAKQALAHPWIKSEGISTETLKDILPKVRAGFSGRKTFRAAVEAVKSIRRLSSFASVSSTSLSSRSASSLSSSMASMKLEGLCADPEEIQEIPDDDYFLKNPPIM